MSLLIDALKQAEASRLQAEQSDVPVAKTDKLSLEPLTSKDQAISNSDNARIAVPATSRTSGTAETNAAAVRANARELFAVKQKAPSRVPLIVTVIGLSLLAAGACYLWWATRPRGLQPGPGLATSTFRPATNSDSANAAASPGRAPAIKSIPPTQTAPANIDSPVRMGRHSERQASHSDVTSSPARPQDSDVAQPIVRHSTEEATSNAAPTQVQLAYDAWQLGDIALARSRYAEVLQQEPHNIDALDALGMIALHSGQADSAERYFRDALVVNPKDATAVAQLGLLYMASEPVVAENQLRSLLAEQPNSSVANFALGSLFAKQGRWSEAQQSFFQAYTLDANNPDVLYNLAVSLDHLHQPKPAQQYYEQAVQAARLRPASFDPAVARSRAQSLASAASSSAASR